MRSQQRAGKAIAAGFFAAGDRSGRDRRAARPDPIVVDKDEHPRPDTTLESLAKLKTPFRNPGTVTAGNASGVNDGAAALILASEAAVKKHGLTPRARVLGMASAGVPPRIMGIGPVPSTRKLMERLVAQDRRFRRDRAQRSLRLAIAGVRAPARACPTMPSRSIRMAARSRSAIRSACRARGLPMTAMHALEERGGKLGLATMCVGVGQGVSLALERV